MRKPRLCEFVFCFSPVFLASSGFLGVTSLRHTRSIRDLLQGTLVRAQVLRLWVTTPVRFSPASPCPSHWLGGVPDTQSCL